MIEKVKSCVVDYRDENTVWLVVETVHKNHYRFKGEAFKPQLKPHGESCLEQQEAGNDFSGATHGRGEDGV
jgi:hypothetical protein